MNILSALIEISIYSAVILLAILLFKKVLHKKLSAGVQFALWSLFILRLLLPFSIDSGLHLVTYDAPPAPPAYVQEYVPSYGGSSIDTSPTENFENIPSETTIEHPNVNEQITVTASNEQPESSQSKHIFEFTLSNTVLLIWLSGTLFSLIYMTIVYAKLRSRVYSRSTAVMPANIFRLIQQCEQRMNVKRPCEVRISNDFDSTVLLAALRPKLIIPAHMLNHTEVLEHCLLHEFAHYKRRDYLMYLLTNVLCAVYWFNPCVWIGTRLMKQDMESACDALVIKTMNDKERDKYANTLLSMFSNQPKRFQIAMGMGIATKKEAEKRLRGVYMRRKTSIGTKLTVALLALVMLTTCFTTACQPMEAQSIEQDTIATDTPLATASTLPFNQGEIPKHWTETVKISNCLTVNIDTDIVMPKAEQYPVIKVEPISWTQQRIDEMVNYFAKGKKLYEWPRIMTKADYEKELVEARKGSYTDYEYVVTEESLAWVKELEEKKANAPVEAPKKYTDTTLTYRFKDLDGNKDTAAGMNFLSVGVENSDYNDAHIYVCNYSKDLGTNRNGSSNKTSFYYSQGNGYHSESFNEYLIAYIEAEMQSPIDEQFKDKRDVELMYLSFHCVYWIPNCPLYSAKTGIKAPLVLVDIML